ncbi:MAG: hypothetical protein IPJ89_04220 [Candidatus Iainarchaeum archaeon]|uniref:Uncharacterized protein n=1 Tax=Candidatus Iainarchaeum sp. TaxID=3101447 RepID=A0A7T9I1G8_9ARCH|nr:MAG: hypothetical protein IPJ89_04220 [Candidatus Diapherotrites archaeon]
MSGRFAAKNHSKQDATSTQTPAMPSVSIPTHLLVVAIAGLVVLGLIVGVSAQAGSTPGSGTVSHRVGDIDFTQAFSGYPSGRPAPITPTVAGVPVPEPLATMQKFVQAAAWGTGSGVVAESAVTANTANVALNANHLETWTLAQVLAAAGGNDTIYMRCPVAGGPIATAAPGQPFSLQDLMNNYSAANCPNGASDIACPTIGGTAYTSKGVYFEPGGLGMSYVLSPVYAGNGSIINYNITFFSAYVGSIVNVCTKNA